jgi:hypothetical protein
MQSSVPKWNRWHRNWPMPPARKLAARNPSMLAVKFGKSSNAMELALARDWWLIPLKGGNAFPSMCTLFRQAHWKSISKTNPSAGDYQLVATWDWDPNAGNWNRAPPSLRRFRPRAAWVREAR